MSFFKGFLRSPLLDGQSKNRKIAYLGVMTAFAVIANTLFEFKLMDTQFSLTLSVSALLGVMLGGIYGFAVCFLGDLIGFLMNSSGFAYMPWIGLSMGITSLLTGVLVNGVKRENKGGRYAMIALSCAFSFVVCSVGINTTAFYFLYAGDGVSYWTYFVARFIVKGQLWNCIFNYALVFGGVLLVDKLLATVKK
ncbi:MAG: ECF transporter S component [Clostridiales bacterium]|nr:ECF transporter S component [Clostridiales bacterium]